MSELRNAVADGLLTEASAQNIEAWLSRPWLQEYADSIRKMIAAGDWKKLDELFWTVLPFGTGGRRGPMGELGSATVNERTIAESAAGMAAYLRSVRGASGGRAVVACDTRHHSTRFARLTACVFAAAGLEVFLFDGHRSTPELSFAVRHLKCDIGAMISASHNPPADNGFKAYWSNGAQVIPPHDRGIIEEVMQVEEIGVDDFDQAVSAGRIHIIGSEVDEAYTDAVLNLSLSSSRNISAVYSPLHGVGETSIWPVVEKAGFSGVTLFEPHREPDGGFPNVPDHLPNPELPAVFDPMIEWVSSTGHPADLIMASDPDADRLGVVVRNDSGGFTGLSGNQVGALLVDFALRKRKQAGRLRPGDYVVETLVTTPLTRAVAEAQGAECVYELLVGFKYIAQVMEERGTDQFVFGTEESIGFLAGDHARDKDASVAALYVLELAAELKAEGRTLLDQLDELYRQHGYYCEAQKSIYCHGPTGKQQIDHLMKTLRENPPQAFGSMRMQETADYKSGLRRSVATGEETAIDHPRGDLLIFHSDRAAPVRVQIAARPSGTEPKIKFYFFCQSDVNPGTDLSQARALGDSVMDEVRAALSEWAAAQTG